MAEHRIVLVLGGSNVTTGGNGPPLVRLLEDSLDEARPGEWTVRTATAMPGRSMTDRALRAVREHQPDVVVLAIPAAQFTYEFVVNRLRRRLPFLYRPALSITQWLKAAAGGEGEPEFRARGLIYRVPEALGLWLIGGETSLSVEHAIQNTTETIEALLKMESLPMVVRQPVGGMRASRSRSRRYEERLRRFREAIAAVCARHRVPCVDVAAGLEVAGLRRGAGPDGIHLNDSTRRFEAGLLTTAILEAAGPGSLPAPPPAGREPAGAGAQASHF